MITKTKINLEINFESDTELIFCAEKLMPYLNNNEISFNYLHGDYKINIFTNSSNELVNIQNFIFYNNN